MIVGVCVFMLNQKETVVCVAGASVRHKNRKRQRRTNRKKGGLCLCAESENMIVCLCVFMPNNGDFRLESM